ncbi:uncharacterized protein LOC132783551 [Drosophila nasuta]|uniref:uncharacterized protein LOC132783551 n=1 Tax=Drosophila nasuta TaxID=42062 RepID=UPI00295E64E5|nr:uncharacterized protein LOC132783551 [Drosophila nasuta]
MPNTIKFVDESRTQNRTMATGLEQEMEEPVQQPNHCREEQIAPTPGQKQHQHKEGTSSFVPSQHGNGHAFDLGSVANLGSSIPINCWHRFNAHPSTWQEEVLPKIDSEARSYESNAQCASQSQLPQAGSTWPSNEQVSPAQSASQGQFRTYGNPMVQQHQPRPTILVIVVNKHGESSGGVPGVASGVASGGASGGVPGRASGNYQPPIPYPMTEYQVNYQPLNLPNGYTLASRYPIGGYQKGGWTGQAPEGFHRSTLKSNVSNQAQAKSVEYAPDRNQIINLRDTAQAHSSKGSDSGQERKNKRGCCCCPRQDTNTRTTNEEKDEQCLCDNNLGALEKTLESLIPSDSCICYLAKSAKKKRKKRKQLPFNSRFANPPFVIEPKPKFCNCCCHNPCSFHCCKQSNNSCCNNCCNPCCPWC